MEPDQEALIALVTYWGIKVLAAVLILVVGKWLAGRLRHGLRLAMERRRVDPSLIGFLCSLLYYGTLTAVVISAVGQLGIKTTSFIAVLGAAGLAVGLALQGSLSNFAAGTLLMLFRPFQQGDFVEAGGTSGTIVEIGVLMTIMHSPQNKKIYVPNSQIMSGTITNATANDTRRTDLVIGVSYDDDVDRAKEVIRRVVTAHPKVLAEPAPTIELWELGESSVNFIVRPWTDKADSFSTRCELLPALKKALEADGLSIPYPQRDVHLHQK